jgi:hypothetical protein
MHLLSLAVLAAALLAATSILWFAVRTGIAPVASSRRACRAMVEAAESAPPGPIVDLGAGWGTLAIALARRFPDRQVIGYELSWVPWAVSRLLRRLLKLRNLTLRRGDFLKADLSGAAVLTCYLYRQGMRGLQRKLARDRQPPTVIVSNTFTMPASRPCAVVTLEDFYRTRILVYRWDPRGCTGDEGLTRPRPPAPLAAPDRARSTRTGP